MKVGPTTTADTITVADTAIVVSTLFPIVIVQPTTLCNLDCGYCYLPHRRRNELMTQDVARSVVASIDEQGANHPTAVVWHGGEPLATPIAHFRDLLETFEDLRRRGAVEHNVQTNATLITSDWCELVKRYSISVGISVDGPRRLNRDRVDRSGRETHDRALHGVRLLRDAGINFSAICVVTPQTIGEVDSIVAFFDDLGSDSVGFNIEEREGVSTARPMVEPEQAYLFWQRLLELRASGSPLRIREFDRLASYVLDDQARRAPVIDTVPAVGHDGSVVLLSPELAGIRDKRYDDFIAGNVLTESIPAILRRAHRLRYFREFAHAVAKCAAACEFYDFCRGAHASNRYFETGTFTTMETSFCRSTQQALVRAAVDLLPAAKQPKRSQR
ncbi:MAG TPA: radical SAM protein [Micromonosporaceae bacterium]|nr:radical SAM protein [Micromonosporaceae bacterium]